MIIFALLSLPFAYFAAVIYFYRSGVRSGLAASLGVAGVTAIIGLWLVLRSDAPDARIGYLFVPLWASLSGAFALIFGRLWPSPRMAVKVVAGVALVAACAVPVLLMMDSRQRGDPGAAVPSGQVGR